MLEKVPPDIPGINKSNINENKTDFKNIFSPAAPHDSERSRARYYLLRTVSPACSERLRIVFYSNDDLSE